MPDALLTFETFSDKIDQTFVIDEPGVPPIPLKLIEAKLINNYLQAERAPFSLLFTTQGDFILQQRMFQLRNDALGSLAIFIVPVAKSGDIVTYQAIFN
jgi:Domain of unknown function (DUF6916)